MSQQRQLLYQGVSHAAWGYFFLYFDLNLNGVSLLPEFVGYLLFLSALRLLEGEERDLSLLRPLGILLGLWTGAEWLFSWAGGSPDGLLIPLDVVVQASALYFHFQLFTDLARVAARYQGEGEGLDRRLLRLRTVQALLSTAIDVAAALLPARWNWIGAVYLVLGLAGLAVAMMLMSGLFALRKCFTRPEASGQG